MSAIITTVSIMLELWWVGFILWFRRMDRKWKLQIREPWDDAVAMKDDTLCNLYYQAAHAYLADYKISYKTFYPLHWIETWNKDYVPDLHSIQESK